MRSAKSVISGFGVAVSLIGAAACAFSITAALVALHVSFAVSAPYKPQSAVQIASARPERPIVIAAAPRVVARPRVTSTVAVPFKQQAIARAATPLTVDPPAATKTAPPKTSTQVPPKTTTTTQGPPSTTAPLANATVGLTHVVGGVLANATNSLGNTVTAVSPAIGGTLHGLGTGLANGVVALGSTVAALVTALGAHPAAPQG